MMSKYYINYSAHVRGTFEIEADSKDDALKIAEDKVWDGDLEMITKVIDAEVYE